MARNKRVSANAPATFLAFDHTSGQGQPMKNQKQLDRLSNAYNDSAGPNKSARAETGRSSAGSSSDGDDADEDVSNDEDDEDEGGKGNGDALAPSDCAMTKHGNRAGRFKLVFKNGSSSTRKRRASSAGLESLDHRTKHARSPSRNAASYDESSNSDDEAYNGVDLVSDAEEESDVERLEEKNIINSEDENKHGPAGTVGDTNEASDGWDGSDLDEEFFIPVIPYFEDQFESTEPGILDGEAGFFGSGSESYRYEPLTSSEWPTHRQVRFKDSMPPQSDSLDMVNNDGDLNGLFNTNEVAAQTVNDNTFDYDNEDTASAAGNSSGYETDYGDTTDEDPKPPTTRPQSLLRQPSLSLLDPTTPSSPSAAPDPFKMPGAPARSSRGPRLGSFNVDPTKACAMIDSTGSSMVIIPAKRPPKINTTLSQIGSTRTSTACPSPITPQRNLASAINDSDVDRIGFLSQASDELMLATGVNMSSFAPPPSIVSGYGGDKTLAEPSHSVFVPMDSMGNLKGHCGVKSKNDDKDSDEDDLKVEAFIDFGVDTEDEEAEEDEDAIARATLPTPLSTSPTVAANQIPIKTPSPDNTSASQLLKHFDKGNVGSFRRGQSSHQQQTRHTQAGPSLNKQAFKGGRHAAANLQLGAQKRKLSDSLSSGPSHAIPTKKRLHR